MSETGFKAPGNDQTGLDRVTNPLHRYAPHDANEDIFAGAGADVAAKWQALAAGLAAQAHQNLDQLQAFVDRHVEDLGLAFRITGDEQERPWPLNPMPVVIGADEWATISAGLVQRANLLEGVIADIYGAQQLVADGHLPAAVISGSVDFARRMVGVAPTGGKFLHILAIDLARGPGGKWCVLADRVRLPTGIGYALENRLAMMRATGGLLTSIHAERQSDFLDALRQGLAQSCERADPRIALLTPGRFNQAYPEQAHLARHLGFSLVEGRDLAVRDGRLYIRTIAGLKRIDAVWRWIRTGDLDPLNFDARSQIGVPDFITACEQGLVVANWPGAGVVETRAMPAFLPRLAKVLLGEDLALPNVATWWCGGETERSFALGNLDKLVISSSFGQPVVGLADGHTRAGASLTAQERATIIEGMARRPADYTAQEIVRLSTTPVLLDGQFEPRAFTLRAFLCRDGDGNWIAMPGGFARISENGELRTSLMGSGDTSADVCVVAHKAPVPATPPPLESPPIRRNHGVLPSQAADNLYWIGRYGERGHQTVRIVRTLLEQISRSGTQSDAGTATARLCALLRNLGAAPRESIGWQPSRIAETALMARAQSGSVVALAGSGRQIALLLRERLTRDSWRLIHRPMPRFDSGDLDTMTACCDELLERYAALARLTADAMSRTPAWRFLDLGISLERASMIMQAVQGMVPGSASAEDLHVLLDLIDGQALYRARYLSLPTIAPVLDMVLLDPAQPRGLAFQLERIEDHLGALPALSEDGLPEPQLVKARLLRARVAGLLASEVNVTLLSTLRDEMAALSNTISKRYFLQDENPVLKDGGRFLA